MSGFIGALFRMEWSDPRVIGFLAAVAIVALARKWSFVLLLALVVTLAEGLNYLLAHSSLQHEFTRGIVIGVYAFGGLLLLFLAIAHAFTRE